MECSFAIPRTSARLPFRTTGCNSAIDWSSLLLMMVAFQRLCFVALRVARPPSGLFLPPAEEQPDVTRQPARPLDDRRRQLELKRLQLVAPEFEGLPWTAHQRVRPVRLAVVQGAPLVGAEHVWKAHDHE